MSLHQTLFPSPARSFRGQRWANITLRTLHLIGVSGLGGAWLYDVPEALWRPWAWLALASGLGMVALALWSSALWMVQARGLLIGLKLLLLVWMVFGNGPHLPLMLAVLVISGVIAHAPGALRYWSPWRRARP